MPQMEVHARGEDSEDDELKTARRYVLGGAISRDLQQDKNAYSWNIAWYPYCEHG
jgi:hypothetical protein